MKGRLLNLTLEDPYSNVAFEEALLREAKVPTLRLWENQTSVVIGRAQMAGYETDLTYCAEHQVPVVRRVTAGGTVYNGPGNLNWSFVLPRGSEAASFRQKLDAKTVFESFAHPVVASLKRCGVAGRFVTPNSIVDEAGKVSGLAAFLSNEGTLCHGTLLVEADLALVRRLTKPREVDVGRRYPRSRFVEVANCGVDRSRFDVELASTLGGFEPGEPTKEELTVGRGLEKKYRSDAWNLGDPFGSDDL